MAQRRLSQPEPVEPPLRPRLADQPSRFVLLEREVELEYRPQMLEALQRKVNMVAEQFRGTPPECPRCGQPMMLVRSPGWRTGGGCVPLRRGTVARRASRSVDPCWIFWA